MLIKPFPFTRFGTNISAQIPHHASKSSSSRVIAGLLDGNNDAASGVSKSGRGVVSGWKMEAEGGGG